jgi:enoyl-CoA hydratase
MLMTGEPISAEQADRFGLLNRVVDDGQALQAAVDLARAVAANAPLAVQGVKQLVRESGSWTDEEIFSRQVPITDVVFSSQDAEEGRKAFAEKRLPIWQGK